MDDQTFDNKTAQEWIRIVEGSAGLRDQDIYPLLKTWVELCSPRALLEIGCGQGICSDKIDLAGRHYKGLDPSSFLIERANELYSSESRRFLVGNVYDLPFSKRTFDAVFSVALWHLLSDLPKAASELARVLRDQGQFLIVTANPHAYSAWRGLYTTGKMDGQRFEGEVCHSDQTVSRDILYLPTLEEILNSLQKAGLQTLATEFIRCPEGAPNNKGLFLVIRGQKFHHL